MPEMDGYQATTKIRSDSRFKNLPIIAMTAHATTEERQRCLDAGMNNHVAKPIDPVILYETIGQYYQSRKEPSVEKMEAAAEETDLPAVAGLNTKEGLSRVGGNRKLYVKLLQQFLAYQNSPDEIANALKSNDWQSAERLAHTVKGVAGSIGVPAIQQAAAVLESAFRARTTSNELEGMQKEFAAVLTDFLTRLRAKFPEQQQQATPAKEISIDSAQLKLLIQAMMTHLNNFDPFASDYLDENRDSFHAFLLESYDAFEKQVASFAFADALITLQDAAKTKGILLS
jgi:two-component system sensor histidine kinase/response regulator